MRSVLWVAGAVLLLLTIAWRSGIHLNLTASMPAGLYVEANGAPTRGSIVLACLPSAVAALARERGYVPRGERCPGGTAPVGKVVLAVQGDTVTLTAKGLELNGREIPNSRPLSFDSRGRRLVSPSIGPHLVGAGELWLVAPSPLSFDSRYFGPVAEGAVLTVVRPLWTAGSRSLRSLPP